MGKIDIERQKTLEDLNNKLREYGKCLVVRGTGFGKTTMASKLTKKYKKILFLFPSKIIQVTANDVVHEEETGEESEEYYITDDFIGTQDGELERSSKLQFQTYHMLVRDINKTVPKCDWTGYDLIIADECHRLGAKKTIVAIRDLLKLNPNAHFVGLSATPERPDKKLCMD